MTREYRAMGARPARPTDLGDDPIHTETGRWHQDPDTAYETLDNLDASGAYADTWVEWRCVTQPVRVPREVDPDLMPALRALSAAAHVPYLSEAA